MGGRCAEGGGYCWVAGCCRCWNGWRTPATGWLSMFRFGGSLEPELGLNGLGRGGGGGSSTGCTAGAVGCGGWEDDDGVGDVTTEGMGGGVEIGLEGVGDGGADGVADGEDGIGGGALNDGVAGGCADGIGGGAEKDGVGGGVIGGVCGNGGGAEKDGGGGGVAEGPGAP